MQKTKKIGLISLILIFCLSFAFAIISLMNVTAQETNHSTYELNKTFIIPEGTISNNGNEVAASEYFLVYPNGLKKSGRSHVLDMAGKYTIEYCADVDGVTLKETESFVVENALFQSTGNKSSSFYGVNKNYKSAPEGLAISIANGEEFKFNKIIDISNKTKKDKILSFYITPTEKGTYDAANLVVRFTDIYNPDNYVDVTYRCLYATRTWAKYYTYIVAQSAGNAPMGGKHVNNVYGWATKQTFCGESSYGYAVGADPYNLMFDYEARQIWTDHAPADEKDAGLPYIADLDDASIFTNPWEGFTTGEVYVSIYATSYKAPTMNIVMTYLDGYNFTESKFTDKNAPTISVDMAGEASVPNGLQGNPYKIFNATAVDAYSGIVDVKTNVYYRYGTNKQISVFNKDGYFIPSYAGTYTIEYSAVDYFGNKAVITKEIDVEANADSLDFSATLKMLEGLVGETIECVEGFHVYNNRGCVQVVATATCGEKRIELDENFQFNSLEIGDYDIHITVSDYVETITKKIGTISLSANPNPVFAEDAVLVAYFITGQKYVLQKQQGYDVASGIVKDLIAQTYIVQDDGDEELVDGDFTVTATDKVQVIYRLTNENTTVEKTVTVKAVNPINEEGNLDSSKYFYLLSGDAHLKQENTETDISATLDSKLMFINAVQVEEFKVEFEWNNQNSGFKKLNFYLTDSEDINTVVKISYIWKDETAYMSINDGKEVAVPKHSTSTNIAQLMLGYDNATKQIYGNPATKRNVEDTFDGNVFTGFPSGRAYLAIEMLGVEGTAVLTINKINNQAIYLMTSPDDMEPEIIVDRSNGDVALNSEVVVYGARVYDVFSASTRLTLQVIAPNGDFAKDINGNVLDTSCNPYINHTIVASEYGTYSITYTARDAEGNKQVYSYGFVVKDLLAPSVNVDTTMQNAKVGATIKIRNYSVSDNISNTANLNIEVYVIGPDYSFEKVSNNKFVANKAGTYSVYFYCYDEAGNVTVKGYKVKVS